MLDHDHDHDHDDVDDSIRWHCVVTRFSYQLHAPIRIRRKSASYSRRPKSDT